MSPQDLLRMRAEGYRPAPRVNTGPFAVGDPVLMTAQTPRAELRGRRGAVAKLVGDGLIAVRFDGVAEPQLIFHAELVSLSAIDRLAELAS